MSIDANNISNELDNLAKSYKLYRFKTELQEIADTDDTNRITLLTKAIDDTTGTNKQKENKNKIQDAFEQIDKMVYMKPWNKLPDFHKKIKLKEFINENYKSDYTKLETLLFDAIEQNLINKNIFVIYDNISCKITSIPVLKKNDDGTYKLEIPSKKIIVKSKLNKK